ncbi:MAG: alpha/beta hydrolase [Bernardetiaceae bacterium]|nr:alpha/beta hydrolase [Bernardetiaceae bacterium]
MYASNQRISFQIYGKGSKNLIAFHGFGQDASLYANWQTAFSDYTIYSIDLFFHGNSQWQPKDYTLYPEEWQEIFYYFLEELHIKRFEIAAFSLGGRIALSTYGMFYEQIDGLWLLGVDGIKSNFWYQTATRYSTARKIFAYTVAHPRPLHYLIKGVGRLKIFNKSVIKLAEKEIADKQRRMRVHHTWLTYRILSVSTAQIIQQIRKQKIPVRLFAGKYDKLVPPVYLRAFAAAIPEAEFTEFDCGHFKIPEKVVAWRKLLS